MLRCPGTLTLDYERWSSYRKKDARLYILCLWPRDLYGPILAIFIVYRDWPLVALNPLTALRGYLYNECSVSNFPDYGQSKYELSSRI